MAPHDLRSIPGVCDVTLRRGADAPDEAPEDLLLEVPHGATRAVHFESLAARMRGPLPEGLRDYFFVNTDVGAPEVAEALAARVAASERRRAVLVVRSLVPRTFVDCNRRVAPEAVPSSSKAGETTPGVGPYVRDPADRALLFDRHAAYTALVDRAYERVCGAGGTALMLHSYAPRDVDVPVDERIVERLREAYRPEVLPTWPLRAEVDLISKDPQGRLLAPAALVRAVRDAFARAGLSTAEGATYSLHPLTQAHARAARFPGRTLCLEMRRDLLARAFTPFREMEVDPARADRMAAALEAGLRAWWAAPAAWGRAAGPGFSGAAGP